MTMIDDLVFDLPHPGGLHDLLEHRSLDRPKLPVRNCLQLNNVLFDTIIIIIIVTIDANHHHHHDLDARCSLAVVEDRQLSKSLPNSKPGSASCHSSVVAIFHDQDDGDDDNDIAENCDNEYDDEAPAQDLAILDHLVLSLGRNIQVGTQLS